MRSYKNYQYETKYQQQTNEINNAVVQYNKFHKLKHFNMSENEMVVVYFPFHILQTQNRNHPTSVTGQISYKNCPVGNALIFYTSYQFHMSGPFNLVLGLFW